MSLAQACLLRFLELRPSMPLRPAPNAVPHRLGIGLAVAFVAGAPAAAQGEAPLEPAASWAPGWLSLGGELIYESTTVLDGGVRRGTSDRHLLLLGAEANLDQAFGTEGAGSLTLGFATAPPNSGGSLDIGDVQIASNIETDRSLDHILEFVWRSDLGGPVELALGKLDADDDFAAPRSATGFSHSSAGFGPTIFTFPSYPEPATAACVFLDHGVSDGVDLRLGYGLFDGALGADGISTGRRGPSSFISSSPSNDFFHILQADLLLGGEEGSVFSAGAWYHDGRFSTFDGGEDVGTGGTYFVADVAVTDGWRAFTQVSFADRELTEFGAHYGAGFVGPGPREEDEWGLYWSHVDLVSTAAPSDESAFDLYGRFQLTEHLAIQPELMWIRDPGGRTDIDDATVAFLRLIATF